MRNIMIFRETEPDLASIKLCQKECSMNHHNNVLITPQISRETLESALRRARVERSRAVRDLAGQLKSTITETMAACRHRWFRRTPPDQYVAAQTRRAAAVAGCGPHLCSGPT